MKARGTLSTIATVLIAALSLAGVLLIVQAQPAAATPPTPGSVIGLSTRTFANARVITGESQITYTTAPLVVAGGLDVSRSGGYYSADSFVAATLGTSATLAVVPQVSPDKVIWVSLPYTATIATSGQTDLQQFVLAGEYLRYSIASSGTVTVSIKATLHNNK